MICWRQRLERLFVFHGRRLEAMVARRVKDRDVAAEIVQDVFCRVLRAGSHGTLDDDTKVLYASDATFYNWRKKYAGLMLRRCGVCASLRTRTPS